MWPKVELLCIKFKEKHMKNLKYEQNYCWLNIEMDVCTEPIVLVMSLWDLIALREPRISP